MGALLTAGTALYWRLLQVCQLCITSSTVACTISHKEAPDAWCTHEQICSRLWATAVCHACQRAWGTCLPGISHSFSFACGYSHVVVRSVCCGELSCISIASSQSVVQLRTWIFSSGRGCSFSNSQHTSSACQYLICADALQHV